MPNLKFKIDPKKDAETCCYFFKSYFDGHDNFLDLYLPDDFKYIKDKKLTVRQRNKIVREYVDNSYNYNDDKIKSGLESAKKQWKKKEKEFYNLVDKIFKGYKWPKGDYIGYVSIFKMYPRDIKEKTFFFPYEKTRIEPTCVIAHEMMHFIFFDFIKKYYKLSENSKIKGKDDMYVWQVSETFNTVIENWKPYKKVFSDMSNKPYRGCESIYKKMKKIWEKDKDIKKLLDCFFV